MSNELEKLLTLLLATITVVGVLLLFLPSVQGNLKEKHLERYIQLRNECYEVYELSEQECQIYAWTKIQ